MPDRKYSAGSAYRYGFNGQEKSTEINQALTTAEFWEYDVRLGSRWNVDPITTISQSPFVTFNNPLRNVDPSGSTTIDHTVKKGETLQSIARKYSTTVADLMTLNKGYIKNRNKIRAGDKITVISLPDPAQAPQCDTKSYEELAKAHPSIPLAVSVASSQAEYLYAGGYESNEAVSPTYMNSLTET